ncbi:MAG: hypothetical protein WDO56_15575 [Gammaproteobacteria bacterium]
MKIHPHGQLTPVEDNILTVTGTILMPAGRLPRRMTVVRLPDRRLVLFSVMSLDDEQMAVLEAFGQPAFMIVPNDHHRMDAKSWRERYPALRVIAPAGSRQKVEKVVLVDATFGDFGDPSVRFVPVNGTAEKRGGTGSARGNRHHAHPQRSGRQHPRCFGFLRVVPAPHGVCRR